MNNIKKIYFGQAMDNQNPNSVFENHEIAKENLKDFGFDLISTYTMEKEEFHEDETLKERAKRIVEFDLNVLKDCDLCLFDLSKKNWVYIGCICEIVYAKKWNKPIIAFTGESGLDTRTFLVFHVDYFTKDLDEAIQIIIDKF